MDTFADDCRMWFPAAAFSYRGTAALGEHFEDFLGTFETVHFHDYTHVVDVESQSICTYFTVVLVQPGADEVRMRNCNIFHVNRAGRFGEIIIYNSGPLDAGFHAGSD